MKKVHYVAAAMAGVIPAVAAGAVPANAQVSSPAAKAGAGVKTVRNVPQYNHNQCTGTIETPTIYSTHGNEGMHFWFTHSGAQTCIGTIQAAGLYQVSVFRVRIWYGNNIWFQSYHTPVHNSTSLGGQTYHQVSDTIRIKAPNPVLVCGAFLSGNTVISAPMCYQV